MSVRDSSPRPLPPPSIKSIETFIHTTLDSLSVIILVKIALALVLIINLYASLCARLIIPLKVGKCQIGAHHRWLPHHENALVEKKNRKTNPAAKDDKFKRKTNGRIFTDIAHSMFGWQTIFNIVHNTKSYRCSWMSRSLYIAHWPLPTMCGKCICM